MRVWSADLSDTLFGKITVVYGRIEKNGGFVRNWSVRKMSITNKTEKQPLF